MSDTVVSYLQKLKEDGHDVVIFTKIKSKETDKSNKDMFFRGKIKHVLDDGIVLEKSSVYEEILILLNSIVSVRKWADKD